MKKNGSEKRNKLVGSGLALLAVSSVVIVGAAWYTASQARKIFLAYEDINPIIAGGELDELPALMRGNVPVVTTSMVRNVPQRTKPPRMCEMPDDYFDHIDRGLDEPAGYTVRNEYVRKYRARRGFLNDREMRAAKVAWNYFELFTQETTGLANSVGNYPSTTLWDTASYMAGVVAAYELCIIEKPELDKRITQLLTTIRGLELFRKEMPNKVYHTKTGAKVDYTNKPGEIGFSALDIGSKRWV